MAKGRMLNKTIGCDKAVNGLSNDTCRLVFSWLIAHVEKNGCFHGDAALVRSYVFPLRDDLKNKDIDKYLEEIAKARLVTFYFVNGERYLYFPGFLKNQRGFRPEKEGNPSVPDYDPGLVTLSEVRTDPVPTPPEKKVTEHKEKRIEKKEYASGVFLTEAEHAKLVDTFTESGAKERIEKLSLYIQSKGKQNEYKDHYATILNWERRDKEKDNGTVKPDTSKPKYETPDEIRARLAKERQATGEPVPPVV